VPIAKRPLPQEDPKDRPPSIWSKVITSKNGQRANRTWESIPSWVKWLFAIGLLRMISRNVDWQNAFDNFTKK
jgi:hypothetical protein